MGTNMMYREFFFICVFVILLFQFFILRNGRIIGDNVSFKLLKKETCS